MEERTDTILHVPIIFARKKLEDILYRNNKSKSRIELDSIATESLQNVENIIFYFEGIDGKDLEDRRKETTEAFSKISAKENEIVIFAEFRGKIKTTEEAYYLEEIDENVPYSIHPVNDMDIFWILYEANKFYKMKFGAKETSSVGKIELMLKNMKNGNKTFSKQYGGHQVWSDEELQVIENYIEQRTKNGQV